MGKIKIHLSYYFISFEALIRPLIVISKSCFTFVLTEFLNNFEKPPVIITVKGFFISFLIKFIILSINPAYPQKKPALTADFVSFPITFEIFLRLIFGIKDALSERVFKESFIPGEIIPPL